MSKDNRVDAFISGLRHHGSHFLITRPFTIDEVREIVVYITRKRLWTSTKSVHSDSDSEDDSGCVDN